MELVKYCSSLIIVLVVSARRYRNITTNQREPLTITSPMITINFAAYIGCLVNLYGPLDISSKGT